MFFYKIPLLLFSHSVMFDSLQPHGLPHARLPCPSPSPQSLFKLMSIESVMASNHLILCLPLLLMLWVFPSIKVFSNELALCISIGQSIGASASTSVLPMNIQGWLPLGLTGLISLLSKGVSRVFSNTTVQKHQFFGTQLSLWSNSHIHSWLLEKPKLWLDGPFVSKVISLLFDTLFRFVTAFLPRSIFLFHGCSHHLQWFWSPRR